MKRLPLRPLGFTLVEVMVSCALLAVAGTVLFSAIRTVSLLSAKNSAINLTHQQSREMIHRAAHQLHSSVAIPSLATASLAPVAGNGPAAGVTYQTLVGKPKRLWSSVAAGTNVVRVTWRPGDPVPQAGMRLIVPAFRIEENITGVVNMGGSPRTYNLTLASSVASTITCTAGSPQYVAFLTERAGLAVVSGTLRHYPRISSATFSTVATNVTSATPFSVPAGDTRFVRANFVTRDSRVAGLNLKSMDTQFQLTVPYRYRLTTRQ